MKTKNEAVRGGGSSGGGGGGATSYLFPSLLRFIHTLSLSRSHFRWGAASPQFDLDSVTPPDVPGLEQEVRKNTERIRGMIIFMGKAYDFW